MGGSRKWIKLLIGLKNLKNDNFKKGGETKKIKKNKWKMSWRSSCSNSHPSTSEASDASLMAAEAVTSAMVAVVREPVKDLRAVKQNLAAIRIQTMYRGILARRALKALKGIVRLQALVRGYQVRKQAAVTFRCMRAVLRVQELVLARRMRFSAEGKGVKKMVENQRSKMDPLKEAEVGWCDSQATLAQIKAKFQMRRDGAIKRERAIAYSLTHQPFVSNSNTRPIKKHDFEKRNGSWSWSWLERWVAAKPWENRLMEELSKAECRNCKAGSVNISKNKITTKVSAKVRSFSLPSSEFHLFESSPSFSLYLSTPISAMSLFTSERTEDSNIKNPSYMNLTESTKAKQKSWLRTGSTEGNGRRRLIL